MMIRFVSKHSDAIRTTTGTDERLLEQRQIQNNSSRYNRVGGWDSCGVIFFFFQAEDGIRVGTVTGVQTCALPIYLREAGRRRLRAAGARHRLRVVVHETRLVGRPLDPLALAARHQRRAAPDAQPVGRSEERRVGKECGSRWSTLESKKINVVDRVL